MKVNYQTTALLIAIAALSVAPASAQLNEMIAWNYEQSESNSFKVKDALILKTIFLDDCLNKTSVSNAAYYQTIQPVDANLFLIKTYFGNGDLKMVGTAQNSNDLIQHGNFEFYYQNGMVESRGKYTNGVKDGIWERFAPDGSVKAERIYTGIPVQYYFEIPAFKDNCQISGAMTRSFANQNQ